MPGVVRSKSRHSLRVGRLMAFATELIHCAITGKKEVCVQAKPQGAWFCVGCGKQVLNMVTT